MPTRGIYIQPDGRIHRFAPPGRKDKSGWYVSYGDHGAYGDWASDIKEHGVNAQAV